MTDMSAPIIAGYPWDNSCNCVFVVDGKETVLDYACALHERWRDKAVWAERAACANIARYHARHSFDDACEIATAIEARALAPVREGE